MSSMSNYSGHYYHELVIAFNLYIFKINTKLEGPKPNKVNLGFIDCSGCSFSYLKSIMCVFVFVLKKGNSNNNPN